MSKTVKLSNEIIDALTMTDLEKLIDRFVWMEFYRGNDFPVALDLGHDVAKTYAREIKEEMDEIMNLFEFIGPVAKVAYTGVIKYEYLVGEITGRVKYKLKNLDNKESFDRIATRQLTNALLHVVMVNLGNPSKKPILDEDTGVTESRKSKIMNACMAHSRHWIDALMAASCIKDNTVVVLGRHYNQFMEVQDQIKKIVMKELTITIDEEELLDELLTKAIGANLKAVKFPDEPMITF